MGTLCADRQHRTFQCNLLAITAQLSKPISVEMPMFVQIGNNNELTHCVLVAPWTLVNDSSRNGFSSTAPSYYLNQYWLILSRVLYLSSYPWINQYNVYENYTFKSKLHPWVDTERRRHCETLDASLVRCVSFVIWYIPRPPYMHTVLFCFVLLS